jgi:hypothetical protein
MCVALEKSGQYENLVGGGGKTRKT